MYMHVFIGSPKRNTPVVIESNIEYAIEYWSKRKAVNPEITWIISASPKISSYLFD